MVRGQKRDGCRVSRINKKTVGAETVNFKKAEFEPVVAQGVGGYYPEKVLNL